MKRILLIICLTLTAGIVCRAQENSKVVAKPAKATTVQMDRAEFVFSYNDETQTSKVAVKYGKKKVYIDSVAGKAELVKRSEYAAKGIPARATTCCQVWWAGAGSCYYIANTPAGIAVYKGREYEEGATKVEGWKKVKEISNKSISLF